MQTTASNSISVKPPSSVLRSSSIRHKNQGNTLVPFLLHDSVAAKPGTLHVPIRRYARVPLARPNQNIVRRAPNPEAPAEQKRVVKAISGSVDPTRCYTAMLVQIS
jgi:hypothetical protein